MGYDPTYGARPLKRAIQKHLVDRLALGLLQGDFAAGDHVQVDAAEGELRFTRSRAAAPDAEPAAV
jgi:ATP-dependent Clp protease ATP-binding subunit ClpB